MILGVGLVAGTYVLTDTINRSFEDIFEAGNKGTDVSVVPHEEVELEEPPPPFDAGLLEQVQGVDGVEEAVGTTFGLVSLIGEDGEPLQTGGAPNFAASARPDRFEAFEFVNGRPPENAGEVALDKLTSDREGLAVGDPLTVSGEGPARTYRISGVATFGEVESFGGASVAVFTPEEAQSITGKEGKFDEIVVAAEDGTSPAELKRRIDAVLPPVVDVRTGQEQAEVLSSDIAEDLGFIKTALLVFAGIALFVGGFTIFNTFSITVAQRTREFAMLRTIGASRRQIVASVVGEALLIGVSASVLGVLFGLLIARALNALFKAVGADLPNTGTVLAPRTIVVSLLIGTIVTVVASLVPALRATRVPPITALREGVTLPPGRGARLRVPAGAAIVVLALATLCVGLFAGLESDNTALSLLGAGAAGIFLGVALLSPQLVRPAASAIGRPVERLRGLAGRLARENTMRSPGRTAVTAAALMVGLALVTFATVFAGGLRASIGKTINDDFAGDLILQHVDGFSPLPTAAGEAVADVEGVAAVSPLRFSESRVEGVAEQVSVTGLDPRTFASVLNVKFVEGSEATLTGLGAEDALVEEKWGMENGRGVGDTLSVTTPTGVRKSYTVRGVIDGPSALSGTYYLPNEALEADFDEREDTVVLVDVAEGTDIDTVEAATTKVLDSGFPTAEALDRTAYKDNQGDQVNQVLLLVYVLLALSVLISLFGIVNTLALSIYERTREFGMLRAIGMSRRQLRQIVRYESVITSIMGAALGCVLGVLLAAVIMQPLRDEGFELSIPVLSILGFMVLAAVAGVLAAILPARRASRLDVLDALAYE